MLDEWQVVPEILGAIKRAVDDDPHPGRFIVTGSVRGDLDQPTWPGTGRLIRLAMGGLSVREQLGGSTGPSGIDQLIAGTTPFPSADPPDLPGYIALALRGGFPEPVLLLHDDVARSRWAQSYVDQLLTRDAAQVEVRDPQRLRTFFEAYALTSAGVVNDTTLYTAAGINRKTALAYERLLENLLVVTALRPWTTNRLSRLAHGSKRFVVDLCLFVGALESTPGRSCATATSSDVSSERSSSHNSRPMQRAARRGSASPICAKNAGAETSMSSSNCPTAVSSGSRSRRRHRRSQTMPDTLPGSATNSAPRSSGESSSHRPTGLHPRPAAHCVAHLHPVGVRVRAGITAASDGERNRARRCRRASLPPVVTAISATPYGDGLQPPTVAGVLRGPLL